MRARRFYLLAILLPALALLIVTPFTIPHPGGEVPLPAGATETWLYPPFAIRELAMYGLVAAWLLWELRRRTPAEFTRVLRWAPLAVLAASIIVLLPFVLMHGALRELFADGGLRTGIRMLVRMAIAYGYVAITEYTRTNLLGIEPADEA